MPLEASKDCLRSQVTSLIQYCEKRRNLNQRLNIGIGLAGIFLGLGATVTGVLLKENASIAAIFGAGSATTQSILFAYPVNKRERIHRTAIAKLQNLLSDLDIRDDIDAEEIETLLEDLKVIRLKVLLEDDVRNDAEETPQPPTTRQLPSSANPPTATTPTGIA